MARTHADFLSPEPSAVHGGPGVGGGVGVAAAVRSLEVPMEAVATDEHVVPKARTQVLPGAAPGADSVEPAVGAVGAHVYGVVVFMGKKRFCPGPSRGRTPALRASCCADEGLLRIDGSCWTRFGEKPHLDVDQPLSSHHYAFCVIGDVIATVFISLFFFSYSYFS